VLNATPGDPAANTYPTLVEAQDYFDARAPLAAWDIAPSQEALLVMATRMIDIELSGRRTLVDDDHYRIGPYWTGVPTTDTQALAWPRTGMYNRNGFAIDPMVVPRDLKYAVAELAGQLAVSDKTLDNAAAVQGIKSASAGPVSVTFKDTGILTTKFLPDAVLALLVPSWYVEETVELSTLNPFDFEVMP
jgi:hypothetical protein